VKPAHLVLHSAVAILASSGDPARSFGSPSLIPLAFAAANPAFLGVVRNRVTRGARLARPKQVVALGLSRSGGQLMGLVDYGSAVAACCSSFS
jgi:hypothetical protein